MDGTPADARLEADVLVTAARNGSDRWMLERLAGDDFHDHHYLYRALRRAHETGALHWRLDGRGELVCAGLDDWIVAQLRVLEASSAPVHDRVGAVERLQELAAWRVVHVATSEVAAGLSHGEADMVRLAELAAALDRIGAAA